MKLAKPIHRIAAYLLDFIITGIITLLVCLLCSIDIYKVFINSLILGKETLLSHKEIFSFYCSIMLSTLLICSYFTLLPFLFHGQTLGMKFFRIKILNHDYEEASLKRLFIREIFGKLFLNFATLFLGNLISLILIVNRKDRKSIADILAATVVVDVEKK